MDKLDFKCSQPQKSHSLQSAAYHSHTPKKPLMHAASVAYCISLSLNEMIVLVCFQLKHMTYSCLKYVFTMLISISDLMVI